MQAPGMDFVVAADSGTHVYRASGLDRPVLLRSLPRIAATAQGQGLVFSEDGSLLALTLASGSVAVYDLASQGFSQDPASPPACEIPARSGLIKRCCFSPLGTHIVTWEPLSAGTVEPRPLGGGDRGSGGPGGGAASAGVVGSAPRAAGTAGAVGSGYPARAASAAGAPGAPVGASAAPSGEGGGGGSGAVGAETRTVTTFTRSENLTVWSLSRPEMTEYEIAVEKDGRQRLGVNVDHTDGHSGLLIRRIDPGLISAHNQQALAAGVVCPGDRILCVNDVGPIAQAMADEIQRAPRLRLQLRRAPGTMVASVAARFFALSLSMLRWPALEWSADERFCFRIVSDEVQVLDGRDLSRQLRRIQLEHVSQISVSNRISPVGPSVAVFCLSGASSSPAMVRVYTNVEQSGVAVGGSKAVRDQAAQSSTGSVRQPALTKSFFSDAQWVTLRWEPVVGSDLLVLVHSSELTQADLEGRTLHGQGCNGLYLLRAGDGSEPIAALSGSQDGIVVFDAQWAPVSGDSHCLVMLQGPQPALISVFTYRRSGGSAPVRQDLGRFGVRSCISWDAFGRSFCAGARSLRGGSETDSLDIFDLAESGSAARRTGSTVRGKHSEKEQGAPPSIASVCFSPDGLVLMVLVATRAGMEMKFMAAADATALYRLKFEAVYLAHWRPMPPNTFKAPEFALPDPTTTTSAVFGTSVIKGVDVRDPEMERRRVKALQSKLRDIDRLKAKPPESLDAQQRSKVASEEEIRTALAKVEEELQKIETKTIQVFDIHTTRGTRSVEFRIGLDTFRDVSRDFCWEEKLDTGLAAVIAERMERALNQEPGTGPAGTATSTEQKSKRKGPAAVQPDFTDKEAVRRRVRALQKKVREIEKLKLNADWSRLDQLQREKLASEDEVRAQLEDLERELDLLDRPPRMVFDIETESGVQHIEYRDGDDCAELARRFCEDFGLEDEMVLPLAEHMEQKLREE
eukprot:TRINITY_DN23127_c0_g2_i1.p1 TRINITY_DN23127_c0_g2~~TRINITY_DN23127_c0_g2_i1.p1  ORF type:complete len:969 (-),score=196.32 TRINITY_DN23127_c0_g2_i1:146-3052(-)